MIGLGLSGALTIVLVLSNEPTMGVLWAALLTVIGSTLIEGSSVGLLQWRVLRNPLPALPMRAWWVGTAAGAFLAWTLGMLPSTLLAMGEESTGAAAPEISQALTLLLASAMGLVAGPVLGLGQWWVLRRHVEWAGWWIPAQAAAWAVGMPIIFQMVDWVAPGPFTLRDALVAAAMLFAAGAAVGAVHGVVVVRLVQRPLDGGTA
jgi:hypothetical protein